MTRLPRLAAWAVASLILVTGLAAVPARADDPPPPIDPPGVGSLTYSTKIQPGVPRSTATYKVTAIASSDVVSNLRHVTLCMVSQSLGATWCQNPGAHPDTQFEMTWSQDTDTFAITGQTNYLNKGSLTDYGDGTDSFMSVIFKFQVSDAMLAGGWKLRVTATDMDDQSASATASGVTVLYFGSVATQRPAVDYGTVHQEDVNVANGRSDGTFIANGPSAVTFSATDFSRTGASLPLDSGSPGQPAPLGKVGMDCSSGSTFDVSSAVRVTSAPALLQNNVFPTGTGEAGQNTLLNSCRLSYTGGARRHEQAVLNTVTVGIGASR